MLKKEEGWKRGDPMPHTIQRFHEMGDLYEAGYLALNKENSYLRRKLFDLRNKLKHGKPSGCPRPTLADCGEIK